MKQGSVPKINEFVNATIELEDEDIKVKAVINEVGQSGWNSLHWAVYLGYADVMNILLNLGGNINAVSDDGWTPLQLAVHKNHYESIEI